MFSFFKDETINNRIILYTNVNIYSWIIQTIFYFYNKENISEKKYITTLKDII